MHGVKPGSNSLEGHQAIHPELRRASEEISRSRGGTGINGRLGQPRGSFDGIMVPENPFQDSAFSATLQDLLPIDLSSRATPDSTTAGSAHRQGLNGQNPLNKLDSLMFPSDDPFAYPNQPMMELGFQHQKRPSRHAANQTHDSHYLVPGSFDDINGQLLGQLPPYLAQDQSQHGHGMAGHGYGPSSMMGVPARPVHGHQVRRAQMQRQQDREIEQLLAQQNYQSEWASGVFSRGGFSGL
jgi:hypothetical protein